MKKYLSKIAMLLLSLAVLTSCEDGVVNYNQENLKTLAEFSKSTGTVPVFETGPAPDVFIQVGVSTVSDVDRTIYYEVDPSSTATPDQYIIEQSGTAIIPAGSYIGKIKVSAVRSALVVNVDELLVLNLIGVGQVGDSNVIFTKGKSQTSLTIKISCPYDNAAIGVDFTGTSFYKGAVVSSFIPTMVQSTVNPNLYTLNTLWGNNFIGDFTGEPGYNGQYLYPGTILINDDLSLTITGTGSTSSATPGGKGTYDPCNETFSYTLEQGLFEDPFTIDVVLTKN